jgi:hypothetical protein
MVSPSRRWAGYVCTPNFSLSLQIAAAGERHDRERY